MFLKIHQTISQYDYNPPPPPPAPCPLSKALLYSNYQLHPSLRTLSYSHSVYCPSCPTIPGRAGLEESGVRTTDLT